MARPPRRRKANGNDDRTSSDDDSANTQDQSLHLLHTPTCSQTLLITRLVDTCERLTLEDTPFALVPCRIGFAPTIDNAATAVVLARSNVHTHRTTGMRHYSAALKHLKQVLHDPVQRFSDQALLSAFLLALYENTTPQLTGKRHDADPSQAPHRNGVTAMLLARAAQQHCPDVGEVVRAVFYQAWQSIFLVPIRLGAPSPFDTPFFHSLDPPTHWKLPPDFVKLRKTSQQLFVRLPELIISLRQFKVDKSSFGNVELCRLARVAQELLHFRDDGAENSFLHELRIVKSSDQTCTFMPFMFAQTALVPRRAGHMYWTLRALIARMYLSLVELGVVPDDKETMQALWEEKLRMAANLIMCWQGPDYESGGHLRSGRHGLAPSLTAAWAALMDLEDFRGVPICDVKDWMLQRLAGPLQRNISSHMTAIEAAFDRSVRFMTGEPMTPGGSGTFNPFEASIHDVF